MDPGDAQPVFDCLQRDGLQLEAILVTHPGTDHMGSVDALSDRISAPVSAPVRERGSEPFTHVAGGGVAPALTCPRNTHQDTPNNLKLAPAVESCNLELINYTQRREELRKFALPALASAGWEERHIDPSLRARVPGADSQREGCGNRGQPRRKTEFR